MFELILNEAKLFPIQFSFIMCENASNIINFTVVRHYTEDRYLIQ